jgi:hypothetical protein
MTHFALEAIAVLFFGGWSMALAIHCYTTRRKKR